MNKADYTYLPRMLYANSEGEIFDHPYFRMAAFSGYYPVLPEEEDLIPLPEFSKLFYIPECPPIGLDPTTGRFIVVPEIEMSGSLTKCFAVAAFLEPGFVRTHLPAADYGPKSYMLPTWAYTAVGFRHGKYRCTAFQVERNHRWDPRNYDDRALVPAIEAYEKSHPTWPLIAHLKRCAITNHCFAAKNLFLGRWEAPMPVSRSCNAACLGCLSLQQDGSCEASHQRIRFRPSRHEIVSMSVAHLQHAPEAIVSFGQGCEGEPLMEHILIAQSVEAIRHQTGKGTINLNTNGYSPERIEKVVKSGLDSARISVNSARADFYRAYYRPKGYDFEHVLASLALCRERGIYTMVNYLVFPGISDQMEEIDAMGELIKKTGIDFIHLKNLNIDPKLYLDKMPETVSPGIGMKRMVSLLQEAFPAVKFGYFNQPVR